MHIKNGKKIHIHRVVLLVPERDELYRGTEIDSSSARQGNLVRNAPEVLPSSAARKLAVQWPTRRLGGHGHSAGVTAGQQLVRRVPELIYNYGSAEFRGVFKRRRDTSRKAELNHPAAQ